MQAIAFRNFLSRAARRCVVVGGVLASGCLPAWAQVPEDAARQAMRELHLLVTEGTGVVGDLQPMINSGQVVKAQVAPEAMMEKLRTRYQKAAGAPLTAPASGLAGEVRQAYVDAYRSVVTRYQAPLTKGGPDAFVPAYFRALVLKDFNAAMKGKLQAYASNRDAELINGDWSIKRVMRGSPLMGEVESAMATGGLEPIVKRSQDRLLGYWPMKLGAACVACHAQNGLKQTEGQFGGALVAEAQVLK